MINKNTRKYVTATVALPKTESLKDTAEKLNFIFPGLHLTFEDTGRYDEVPAYVAKNMGIDFTLFGIPDDEIGDSFLLKIKGEIDMPFSDFRKISPKFINNFLVEKSINSRGFLDYSEELLNILTSQGFDQCEALTQN